MRKIYTILITMLITIVANAQQNAISNPDFEDGTYDGWTLDVGSDGEATFEVVDDPLSSGKGKVLKVTVTKKTTSTTKTEMVKIVSGPVEYTELIAAGDITFDYALDYYKENDDASKNNLWVLCMADGLSGNTQLAGKAGGGTWTTQSNAAKGLVRDPSNTANPVIHIEVALTDGIYYFDNFKLGLVGVATAINETKESNIKVWASDRAITISNKAGQSGVTTVYDLSGRQIKQLQLAANENTIAMPHGGVYILKSTVDGSSLTHKVVVK